MDNEKDARALAQAIRTQVSASLGDIAFLDMEPYYGLTFYLHRDIEAVFSDPPPSVGLWRPPAVQDRLQRFSENRLWLVRASASADFSKAAAQSGGIAESIGSWKDLRFFFVLRR
jgi:hypothetical protein